MQFAYHKLNSAKSQKMSRGSRSYGPMQSLVYSMMFSGNKMSEDILKSLYPYIDTGREDIAKMVEINRSAKAIYRLQSPHKQAQSSSEMSGIERYIGVIRTLKSYLNPNFTQKFAATEQSFERMKEFDRKFGAQSPGNNLPMEKMLPMLMSMGKGGDAGQISQMMNMVNMMKIIEGMNSGKEGLSDMMGNNPMFAELLKNMGNNA